MNVHRNQLFLCLSLHGFYKRKKHVRVQIYQKRVKKLACTYRENSSGEILVIVAFRCLLKKTHTGRNLLRKRHENAHFIILRFAAE